MTKAARWRATSIAGLLTVAAGLWLWLGMPHSSPHYLTVRASYGQVSRSTSATGSLNPQLTIIVGSYVSGVVSAIDCDFNTHVMKGQICAQIDPRPYQTAVDQAVAALATAVAQWKKDQASETYAAAAFARAERLDRDGYVSADAVDDARSTLAQARAQAELDLATIRQRKASLDAARVNLGYTKIVSPVDGIVVSRNVTIGQTVAASFQTPTLFLIATDLKSMQIDTSVSESDIGHVAEGSRARFTVEAFPAHELTGTVTQVRQAPQTVQNVVTYDVVVSVDNSDFALKPGMTATVHIVTDERANVLRVPNQALRFVPGGVADEPLPDAYRRVWRLDDDGQPRAVTVEIGLDDDSYTEIIGGGLHPGDAVIVGEAPDATGAPRTPAPVRFGL